jgi:ATP-dependent Clp protease protease subunit
MAEEKKSESRIIFMFEAFTESSCQRVVKEIIEKANKVEGKEDIKIFINSRGGIVTSLISILDTIQIIRNDVETTCVGQAASCGAVLLSSGAKGKRFITKNSRVLLHQVSAGSCGHVDDMKIDMKEIDRLNELMLKILSKNTGRSLSKLKADVKRDFWLDSKDALKYGIVDKII